MQPIFRIKLLLAIIVTLICTQGCVDSKPIETSTVIDDRPVIMFSFEGTIPAQAIGIYVDNLYMGEAQKYQKGKLGLKIIAGTHLIQLRDGDKTILEKKIYLGRGSTKIITVNTQ